MRSKKDQLKDKVVALVKEFIANEGGISQRALWELFGFHNDHEVAAALAQLPICLK